VNVIVQSANLPAVLACLVLLNACGGAGTPTSPGGGATPPPTPPPASAPSISDDASLYRLVTQTEPFATYTPLPNAEEFTTGRLVGSEAHRPVVRVTLNARAMSALVGGRLPAGGRFPDGSIVFKEIRASQSAPPHLYAVMYRDPANPLAGAGWLWAELSPTGSVAFSATQRGSGCIGCHRLGLGPQNDHVRSFERQQ
jgi:hypothetical protein